MNEHDVRRIVREELEYNDLLKKRDELIRNKWKHYSRAIQMDMDYGNKMGDGERFIAERIEKEIQEIDEKIRSSNKIV